jgi:hypothetical protein
MHLFSAYLMGRTFGSIPGALPSLGTEPPPPSSHPVESALTGHRGFVNQHQLWSCATARL